MKSKYNSKMLQILDNLAFPTVSDISKISGHFVVMEIQNDFVSRDFIGQLIKILFRNMLFNCHMIGVEGGSRNHLLSS